MAARKQTSSRPFGAILALVGLAGVAWLGYALSRQPRAISLDPSLPPMAPVGVVRGSPDALVEVVEFGDFECPGCGIFATLTEPDLISRQVATGEARFRFMDFPLDIHPNAVAAHNAAACANEQGRFWEMHDQIFGTQDRWNSQATRSPKRVLKQLAGAAGADVARWEECYDSGRMLAQVLANRREGERLRVGSTPSFLIGGRIYSDVLSYDQLRDLIAAERARVVAAQAAAAKAPAAKAPAATKRP